MDSHPGAAMVSEWLMIHMTLDMPTLGQHTESHLQTNIMLFDYGHQHAWRPEEAMLGVRTELMSCADEVC